MDGEPQVDDRIPIRVPLAALESLLTPTIAHDSLRLLSVRYYLYLALHDEQRAYFKTQEIFLWRKAEAGAATAFKAS
jgi:vacuolar protein sorting-associated protein 26